MSAKGLQTRRALAAALVEEGDRLYRFALRVTKDPDLAGDAVQEAFASALESADGFRGEARLSTWLHRIVYTKAIDLLRRRAREEPLEDELLEASGELQERGGPGAAWSRPPDALLESAETQQALERAVAELTPLQRGVFELKDVEGRTTEEAAEILDLSPGAVRVHLHRARLRLRAQLAAHFRGARP